MTDDEPTRPKLAPALLLAMPQLVDPNFAKSVVLLCEHSADGAWGLVLNRPTGKRAAAVLDFSPPAIGDSGIEVWTGGPVEPHRGCLLLPEEPMGSEAYEVSPGVYISVSAELLRALVEHASVARARLLMGYAGWGPGQLDQEIVASSWLIADIPPDLVFGADPSEMWEAAMRRLGVDPVALHPSTGIH